MDKQDKFYIMFMVAFIAVLIGVPAFTNTQFEKVINQLTAFVFFLYQTGIVTVHNHALIIHNQEILIHNEGILLKAIELHDNNVSNSLRSQLRNDTQLDFENISLPDSFKQEAAHYDFKVKP